MNVFCGRGCRITSSIIPGGKWGMMLEIAFSEVEDVPDGERRSVVVKWRMRKRPVEGKSGWFGFSKGGVDWRGEERTTYHLGDLFCYHRRVV
jgi:hypothetical protein